MGMIVYYSFVVLSLVCAVLQMLAHRARKDAIVGNNPQFLKFQRGYLAAYLAAMFADWLQGPYLYKLYSYYGFQEEQIAVLYVFGFASTVILGLWSPLAADHFGRKKLCLSFTVLYSLSCLMKLSRSYGILIIGRILGGVATSVLFSAFEAWYIHEHVETYDFPKEWIPVTFSKASTWSGFLAVMAGLTTNIFTDAFDFGPVSPYMMAISFLIFAGVIVSTYWSENYSGHKIKFRKACSDGIKTILSKELIFLIGAIEALVESVIYIVIFLWTPLLDTKTPPLGVIFSCFMICILTGQAVFQLLTTTRNISASILLQASTVITLIASILCVITTKPLETDLCFMALLLFQFGVGIYFPAVGQLRRQIIPEAHLWSSRNWFRVPINMISCVVLMLLHEDVFQHGNRMIFVVCSCLLLLASVCGTRFVKLAREQEETEPESILMTSEHVHNIF